MEQAPRNFAPQGAQQRIPQPGQPVRPAPQAAQQPRPAAQPAAGQKPQAPGQAQAAAQQAGRGPVHGQATAEQMKDPLGQAFSQDLLAKLSPGAQQLSKLHFSDLILNERGVDFFLKGVPGVGPRLVRAQRLGPDVMRELTVILNRLKEARIAENVPAERFAHAGSRYRVSCDFDVMTGRTWFMRRMASHTPPLGALTVKPPYIVEWLRSPQMGRGLCLFAGSQACGKTTLASATVAERLIRYGGHCVTFEAPAEMPLSGAWGDWGYCWQTEIESELDLPKYIVRAHVFASPNIIYIGEIKSATAAVEALRIALGSPDQVVVATIHGTDVISALKRLLDWTRSAEGDNAASNLAMALSTVLFLELKSGEDGKRWQEVPECLLVPFDSRAPMSNGIRAQIREGKLEGLINVIGQMRTRLDRSGLQGLY